MTNLKYYLRGLGVGVVVTALIMGIIAGGENVSLSDEEIKERARSLGMTEQSTVLADTLISQEQDETKLSETEPVNTGAAEPVSELAETGKDEAEASPETEGTEAPAESQRTENTGDGAEPEAQESGLVSYAENGEESFTIEIKSGDSSYSICQKLEDAGLVETATVFDRFLFENEYDKRINTGTFEIPRGADMEQIAKILARME